jgi:hypothetical protein
MTSAVPSPTLYLIGDAGYDEFTCTEASGTLRVPSGVFFMRDTLSALLGSTFSVKALVSDEIDDVLRPIATPTPTRKATLTKYGEVTRISRYAPPAAGASDRRLRYRHPEIPLADHRILVAHHAGESWSASTRTLLSELVTSFSSLASPTSTWPGSGLPPIIINLSAGLPELKPDATVLDPEPFRSELWNLLYEHRAATGIVLSISTLRAEGVAISRRLSWEQGVEDFAAELHLFPRLSVLSRFRHLFVRVGVVGFIHLEHDESAPAAYKLSGGVYFAPYVEEGIYRDRDLEGNTIGKGTIFIAAIVRDCYASSTRPASLKGTFTRALKAMRTVDDEGYDVAHFDTAPGSDPGRALVRASIAHAGPILENSSATLPAGDPDTLSWRPIPSYILFPPPPNALRPAQRWHILDDVLLEAPIHRINVAMAIVKAGHGRVLNRPWSESDAGGSDAETWKLLTRVEYWNPKDLAPDFVTLTDDDWPATPERPGDRSRATRPVLGDVSTPFELNVPVTRFKDLILVERDETETLRGISNLLKLYFADATRRRAAAREVKPISIAVFGPPGSGKSFAVKQIARALGEDKIGPRLEFNVAQYRSLDDLAKDFARITQTAKNEASKIPLVFFDEFDCALGGHELGWLKYFLAPMQDGTFQNSEERIGAAIFVFAGGVRESFDRFDPSTDAAYDNRRDSEEYKKRWSDFVGQKGPDFTSRLRGHINVPSINDAPGRVKHFIRRAIQLRSVLDQAGRVDPETKLARIDDAIVYALLTVDSYHHGVRSMQAIVEMCSPIFGEIQIASLPPRAQLDMHLDAEEFLIRVHRGRVRAQPEWKPSAAAELDWAVQVLKANIDEIERDHPGLAALRKMLEGKKTEDEPT